MKKTIRVNFYIFRSIGCSDGALHIKYNQKTLTETICTKIRFVLSRNIYVFLILWVHPRFVSLSQAVLKYTALPLCFLFRIQAYRSQFYLLQRLLARDGFYTHY